MTSKEQPLRPKILRSKLGDVLCGDYACEEAAASGVVSVVASVMKKEEEETVHDMWRRFFSLEDLGLKDVPGDGKLSLADEEALRLMESHTFYSEKEKKFWTGLPFKEDPKTSLGSNRAASYRLAISSHKKAKKDDEECEKFEKAKVCISKHEDKNDGIYACQLAIEDMNEDLEG